jgi:hypothetical protein
MIFEFCLNKNTAQQREFFGFIYLNKLIERIVADDRFFIKHEHRNIYIMNGDGRMQRLKNNIRFNFLVVAFDYVVVIFLHVFFF